MFKLIYDKLNRNKITTFLIFLLFLISFFTFSLSTMDHDIRVMMASANQVQYFDGNWFFGVYNTWEMKGVFNRLFIYGLYRTANIFIPYASCYLYDVIVNTLFAIFIVVMSALSVKIATSKFLLNPILLLSMAYLATYNRVHIQSEMINCLILIFSFSILTNAKNTNRFILGKLFISGLLLGCLFFIKSSDILMSFSFGVAGLLWAKLKNIQIKQKEICIIVLGCTIMIVLGFLSIILLNFNEIQNMMNASIYENTLFNSFVIKHVFIKNLLPHFVHIPIILLGFIIAIKNSIDNIKSKKYYEITLRIILWTIPLFILFIQNCYYPNHFFSFAFPSIIELYLSKNDVFEMLKTNIVKNELIIYSIFVILVNLFTQFGIISLNYSFVRNFIGIFLAVLFFTNIFCRNKKIISIVNIKFPLLILIAIYISNISIFSYNFYINAKSANMAYKHNKSEISRLNISDYEEILYLDTSRSAFFIGNKSYLDEICPVSLHRESVKRIKPELYANTLNKTLNYNGKYIVLNKKWFKIENHQLLKHKIDTEYHQKTYIYGICLLSKIFINKKKKLNLERIDIYERNNMCQ